MAGPIRFYVCLNRLNCLRLPRNTAAYRGCAQETNHLNCDSLSGVWFNGDVSHFTFTLRWGKTRQSLRFVLI